MEVARSFVTSHRFAISLYKDGGGGHRPLFIFPCPHGMEKLVVILGGVFIKLMRCASFYSTFVPLLPVFSVRPIPLASEKKIRDQITHKVQYMYGNKTP